METERRQEYEPADKPVRLYETALCGLAQTAYFAWLFTHNQTARLATLVALALLMAVALWKLLLPPRLSATRCAFVLIALLGLVLVVLVPAMMHH